jgi:hypothetical protein
LNQISNLQQPNNPSVFLFHFFFSVLSHQYFFSYLSGSSHTLNHIFLPTQLVVQLNCAFGPPTQFYLVIFDIQTPAATFRLPDRRARSSLCHPRLAPSSRLASPSSPPKTAAPLRLSFPISIAHNRRH